MFGVLGDVLLIDDATRMVTVLEEVPVRLLPELKKHTGLPFSADDKQWQHSQRLIVMLFEYGKNFSGAGKDIFRGNRATGEPSEAHKSNFLHPVFYYYQQPPTGK